MPSDGRVGAFRASAAPAAATTSRLTQAADEPPSPGVHTSPDARRAAHSDALSYRGAPGMHTHAGRASRVEASGTPAAAPAAACAHASVKLGAGPARYAVRFTDSGGYGLAAAEVPLPSLLPLSMRCTARATPAAASDSTEVRAERRVVVVVVLAILAARGSRCCCCIAPPICPRRATARRSRLMTARSDSRWARTRAALAARASLVLPPSSQRGGVLAAVASPLRCVCECCCCSSRREVLLLLLLPSPPPLTTTAAATPWGSPTESSAGLSISTSFSNCSDHAFNAPTVCTVDMGRFSGRARPAASTSSCSSTA